MKRMKRMKRMKQLWWTGAILALCGACDSLACADVACGPCLSPVTLSVRRVSGDPLSGLKVSGDLQGACSGQAPAVCHFGQSDTKPGAYSFQIIAADHESQSIQLTVSANPSDGCCACPYLPVNREVALAPIQ